MPSDLSDRAMGTLRLRDRRAILLLWTKTVIAGAIAFGGANTRTHGPMLTGRQQETSRAGFMSSASCLGLVEVYFPRQRERCLI